MAQFTGFPGAGLQFLQDLGHNNNKQWFEANKQIYQNKLLAPAQAFVLLLGEKLQSISPGIRYDTSTNGSGTLMRIYRDTRFSKDKTPYKTNISGLFWEGAGKKTEHPAFGFQLTAERIGLMTGIFGFPKPMLAAYREAVLDENSGTQLQDAITAVTQNGQYVVLGEHYKRVPKGFDPEHPRAELLRYNGLYAHPVQVKADLTSPNLVDICLTHFQKMAPIHQWLLNIN